ncbi:hypothetical protein E2562_006489 [Oryza meyeriana var. granulata]|uniref:Leucine-rich repeat-containing N-terminal plant-type domain-containing protein n=1 Tax=Oryza meyeriana var. granulata TaxID=110450 RepID=A0A6G1CP73_9ORYZ|nr:hypothetical protein E2562_006489 [Oryza meyeriana var. granulata]
MLSDNNLSGELPPELGMHSPIEAMDVSNNNPLPATLRANGKFSYLAASNNSLSGTLPANLSDIVRLKTLLPYKNSFSGEFLV